MTKHDKIFLVLVIASLLFVGMVITQNLSAQTPARATGNQAISSTAYDPAQTEAVHKKFESMGLQPHEGKYWKP